MRAGARVAGQGGRHVCQPLQVRLSWRKGAGLQRLPVHVLLLCCSHRYMSCIPPGTNVLPDCSPPPLPCPSRSYVPNSVTCPQCRQSGVYKGAVRLRQLEKVLKTRWVSGGVCQGRAGRCERSRGQPGGRTLSLQRMKQHVSCLARPGVSAFHFAS